LLNNSRENNVSVPCMDRMDASFLKW
jgi:hypothetical protein